MPSNSCLVTIILTDRVVEDLPTHYNISGIESCLAASLHTLALIEAFFTCTLSCRTTFRYWKSAKFVDSYGASVATQSSECALFQDIKSSAQTCAYTMLASICFIIVTKSFADEINRIAKSLPYTTIRLPHCQGSLSLFTYLSPT